MLTPVEREYLERTRIVSGVPVKVEDPATIQLLAAMLRPTPTPPKEPSSGRICHDCYRRADYGCPGAVRMYCVWHFDKRLRRVTGMRSVAEELPYELDRLAAGALIDNAVERQLRRRQQRALRRTTRREPQKVRSTPE